MRRLVAAVAALAIGNGMAAAQPAAGQTKAADVRGSAERRTSTHPDQWAPLRAGDFVPATSAVRTGADAAVLLSLPDGHVVRMSENTTLEIARAGQDHAFSFSLIAGRIWSFVDKAMKPAKYEVETGSVILGVTGTLFSVARDQASDEVDASVQDGEVLARKMRIQKAIGKGLQLRVTGGRLAFAAPRAQTKATLAMWKAVGSSEKWAKPHGELRLNRELDERAREVRKEREAERRGGAHGKRGAGKRKD